MAKVKIQGNAAGSGVFTVTAPTSNTDRTLTLPDTTGTLLDENSSVPAANLTGTVADARFPATLPAISGANLTNLVSTVAALTDATVSASDPTVSTNPAATGHFWINKTSGESYIATDISSGANVWTNIGDGTDDIAPAEYVAATGPDSAAGVTSGDYKYHIFTATKTGTAGFVVSALGNANGSNTVDYLVIAGGGGGAGYQGMGGGGAGGYRASWNNEASGGGASSENAMTPTIANHNITIGGGGIGQQTTGGGGITGTASSFLMGTGVSSAGGGGGSTGSVDGLAGGSGGGAGATLGQSGGAGTVNQGYDGGDAVGTGGGNPKRGGGGGGAGAVGQDGGDSTGGNGGNGVASTITGSSVTRAGGGGGGSYNGGAGNGGSGGGGQGYQHGTEGGYGTVNTGSGGGCGYQANNSAGGDGGSGVIILRYKFQN